MTSRAGGAVLLMLALLHGSPAIAQQSRAYKGMRLTEALRDLQARGLPIVFSSAIVSSHLRVPAEPRARSPRQQLDELLAPHGLAIRDGPGGTLQVVEEGPSKQASHAPRGSLEGRVVDGWTAAPVPGVLIRVDGHSVEAHTDAGGHFTVTPLARGTRIVTASAVGYIPARRTVPIDTGAPTTVTLRLFSEAQRYREFISVTDSAPHRTDRGVASEVSLDRSDFAGLQGSLAEDPLRAVHSFPSVTPIDDFHGEFAVRGSPFRHVNLVIDGVSTHWLRHTAFGAGATGSLMMVSSLSVESATFRNGAYPRRYGNRLGPELDLSLREGSRREFGMRGAIGGIHAVLAAEGPLGRLGPTGSARGSWLVSARQSYLEWPPERPASSRTPFGFSDGLAKVVVDVGATQQLALTALGGISTVDSEEDDFAANELSDGTSRAAAVSLSWRSTLGPAFVVTQQASIVTHRFWSTKQGGQKHDGGADQALAYRAAVSRPMARGLLQAGGLIERIRNSQSSRSPDMTAINGSSWLRSGFAHVSWPLTRSLTVSSGGRVTGSTLLRTPVVSRWLLGEWVVRSGWRLIGSVGASRQAPDLGHVLGDTGSLEPRSERATHIDLGVEHQLTSGVRWQATLFHRKEADIIRSPDVYPRLVSDTLVFPAAGERHANALQGTSRGIELLVVRRSRLGLSGWATYAYGRTRQTDTTRGETSWADFDQRHTFNVFARYRLAPSTSVAATFRAGSNFPIAGYLAESNGRLVVGSVRNQVRLPPYARLDLRADRQFRHWRRTFTLFVEALNALNRANVGRAEGAVDPVTSEASGFTDTLLRRRMSAGVVFEF